MIMENTFNKIRIYCINTGMMDNNSWLVENTDSHEAFLVDASFHPSEIIRQIKDSGVILKAVLLTHSHYDHILSVNDIREEFGITVYAGAEEKDLLEDSSLNLSYKSGRIKMEISADEYVQDGDEINICGINIKVIHTPGHTKGGICWYIPGEGLLFSGDTLFCNTHGRTDLPTGDPGEIKDSLINKLFILPPDTKVYPGHGEITSIGSEKEHNAIFAR